MLEQINQMVWGLPALAAILGVGLYLSLATGFAQIRLLPKALKLFFRRLIHRETKPGAVSPFQALCTALAATVGTGNLAGVAGAIAIGGPGAVFWMWISGFLGMITKFAEATLAIRYRCKESDGTYSGGPMYVIRSGLGEKWKGLAALYAFLGVIAALGVGNATQINTVICGINDVILYWGGEENICRNFMIGVGLALVLCILLLGGAKRVGAAAERLVPIASVGYILMAVLVIGLNYRWIPHAFTNILAGAFTPSAVTGGAVGSLFQAMRIGVSRGVFTNEAGMGTAGIAHAAAEVEHPVEQGLLGSIEVFLDTIVICTLTALVILCSGIPIPFGNSAGISLTTGAFARTLGSWVAVPMAGFLCAFAFATILGWGLYGGKCAQYLLGDKAWRPYVLLQGVTVVVSAVLNTQTVWLLSDTVNGLMSIPNLIALAVLAPVIVKLTGEYAK